MQEKKIEIYTKETVTVRLLLKEREEFVIKFSLRTPRNVFHRPPRASPNESINHAVALDRLKKQF